MRDIVTRIDPLAFVDLTERASSCCSTLLMNKIASSPKNAYAGSYYVYSKRSHSAARDRAPITPCDTLHAACWLVSRAPS